MGRGSYTAGDWSKLRNSRGLVKNNPVEDLFTHNAAQVKYDSRNVRIRESCDSSDSPCTTPIIVGFDVTASMGYLAKELAVHSMNETVMTILRRQVVPYPHILCGAIGDSRSDRTPLQVTQFEADIRIIEQLVDLCLEGGGGGNGGESYNLLWYFAAKHTKADCFEKRHQKGFLFTIGDDRCHAELSPPEIQNVFGDRAPYSLSNAELLKMAGEKYHLFHIHIESNRPGDGQVFANWRRLLPGRATEINAADLTYLPELIVALMSLTGEKNSNEVLHDMEQTAAEKLARSVAFIDVRAEGGKQNTISF